MLNFFEFIIASIVLLMVVSGLVILLWFLGALIGFMAKDYLASFRDKTKRKK